MVFKSIKSGVDESGVDGFDAIIDLEDGD